MVSLSILNQEKLFINNKLYFTTILTNEKHQQFSNTCSKIHISLRKKNLFQH